MEQNETQEPIISDVVATQEPVDTIEQDGEKPVQAEQADSPQALRFKTLREARERAERERDELKVRLDKIEASKNVETQANTVEDYNIAPDDLVEGKHLSKYDRDIKTLKKELDQYKRQSEATSIETKLRTEFNDFDTVVNKENIEVLRTAYPHLAAALNSSNDLYNKAASAYTMIKKLGISGASEFNKEHEVVQENSTKPRPISSLNAKSTTDSPLTHANAFANGLTKDLKAQLYREMLEAKKRR